MLTLHRAFEGEAGEKKHVFYIAAQKRGENQATGGRKRKGAGQERRENHVFAARSISLSGAKATKWLSELTAGTELLITSGHSADVTLLDLASRGVNLFTAHWHSTGIPRNLEPGEIAERFSQLDPSDLRPFKARPDLVQLRHLVDARQAIMEHRKADELRLSALRRSLGLDDDDESPEQLQAYEEEINSDKRRFENPVDKQLGKIASEIPECQAFNRAAGLKDGWGTAATVVAFLGDMSRFPAVSSLWHYCGQHGPNVKRKRGVASDWHPRLKVALWLLGTSIIKNTKNRWRPIYEQWRDAEIEVHEQKHPGCPTPAGHCGAMARRKVVKEILKEFWVECGEGHAGIENHTPHADSTPPIAGQNPNEAHARFAREISAQVA